jgi:hypothetical protein
MQGLEPWLYNECRTVGAVAGPVEFLYHFVKILLCNYVKRRKICKARITGDI